MTDRLPAKIPSRFFALIPAGGTGSRLAAAGDGLPKQYRLLAGQPMLGHTLQAFVDLEAITATYVVIAPDDAHFNALGLQHRATPLRVGGTTRHASVLNGLDAMRASAPVTDDDWVLVHDAARPGLTPTLILRLIEALQDDAVGGLLALPVADTLKHGNAQSRVDATQPRAGLWQAQTPQMFRYGLLRQALRAAIDKGFAVTDEASAIEAQGLQPKLVPGSARNFKVTQADDLELAEFLFAERTP